MWPVWGGIVWHLFLALASVGQALQVDLTSLELVLGLRPRMCASPL